MDWGEATVDDRTAVLIATAVEAGKPEDTIAGRVQKTAAFSAAWQATTQRSLSRNNSGARVRGP